MYLPASGFKIKSNSNAELPQHHYHFALIVYEANIKLKFARLFVGVENVEVITARYYIWAIKVRTLQVKALIWPNMI